MRLLTHVSRRVVLIALAAAVVFPATVSADSGSGSGIRVGKFRFRQFRLGNSGSGNSGSGTRIGQFGIGQSGSGKLDPLLRAKARQRSGRSRVIVEFRGTPDATILTREGGVARPQADARFARRSQTSTTTRSRRSPTNRASRG